MLVGGHNLKNKTENFIQQKFVGVWHHFLSFEINKSKFAVETFSSANAYLIFQVIAWRHILVMMDEAETKVREKAVELWFKLTETGLKTRTVLIYSLISSLTSLSIETIRRQVKKLETIIGLLIQKKKVLSSVQAKKIISFLQMFLMLKRLET